MVGPDLTEIGSKLARQALYSAVLDPNAGISHNYENYEVEALDGKIETGALAAGQSSGIINEVRPSREIVQALVAETSAALERLTSVR